MKLILIKHGQTEDEVNYVITGKDDIDLTAKGIEETKKLGKELKDKYEINMIFCSPLRRCVETLESILSEYPIEGQILMSKLIEERDFGEYTGMESVLVDWDDINHQSKINQEMGVESLVNLEKRIDLFLEDLKLEDENATVLVISHEEPIKMIVSKITGKKWDEISVKNDSPLVFEDFK